MANLANSNTFCYNNSNTFCYNNIEEFTIVITANLNDLATEYGATEYGLNSLSILENNLSIWRQFRMEIVNEDKQLHFHF